MNYMIQRCDVVQLFIIYLQFFISILHSFVYLEVHTILLTYSF